MQPQAHYPSNPANPPARARDGAASALNNPMTLAIIGGVLSLITGIISTTVHLRAHLEAETAKAAIAEQARKEALQVELIKKFVEHPNPANARANLLFLAQSGLLPDYGDKIEAFLRANPQHALHVPNGRASEPPAK